MTTAFVLSGGGNLGAVQVGMLQALSERDVVPDVLFGTSVGAVNAAFLAGRPDAVDELGTVWRNVRRGDVFPARPLSGLLGMFGRRSNLVSPNGLMKLLRSNLNYDKLEAAPLPISVVATAVNDGREVVISKGDAVQAVAASAAIPGVFPPVVIDGRALMDGGVCNNTPISAAVAAGASPIYVLPTGIACALHSPPRSALGLALHSVTLLIQQRLQSDVERYERIDLRVVPPLCPIDVSPLDFGRSDELMERSYQSTLEWLKKKPSRKGQAASLAIHQHERTPA